MNKELLLTIIFIALSIIQAIGCSCRFERPIEVEYESQQLIVSGKIIEKEVITRIDSVQLNKFLNDGLTTDKIDKRFTHYQFSKYRLVIEESFKGRFNKDTIDIYTAVSGASCGFNFKVGEEYIIYGNESSSLYSSFFPAREYPQGANLIWTTTCTRTKLIDKKELKRLKKISKK